MNPSKIFMIIALLGIFQVTSAQSYWWIGFTDKRGTAGTIEQPELYLSEKALERRNRQGIGIDSTDLPVSPLYLDSIVQSGATLVHSSRWLNGITVKAVNDSLQQFWSQLGFVRELQKTKPDPSLKQASLKFGEKFTTSASDTSLYGGSLHQSVLIGADWLHAQGYNGRGLTIAVLDAGFLKANEMPSLQRVYQENRIAGTRDFVDPHSDFYTTHVHGTMVLSVMAGYLPGSLIGTAYEANYWLIRTEDAGSEYIIEEDHWVAGAEFADSLGADIINSSLGYYYFDDPATSHSYSDMDGRTTRVTKAANIAAKKGMLVFASAGNEANKPWRYIIAPADGEEVIAVGATDRYGNYASFSSIGPAADGAIKPDLAAMGSAVTVQSSGGVSSAASGTSFASPLLAGAAASLWQSNLQATASEIKVALINSGHQRTHPDVLLGYGIPDMRAASLQLNTIAEKGIPVNTAWKIFPNPFTDQLTILPYTGMSESIAISVFNVKGEILFRMNQNTGRQITDSRLKLLAPGLYLIKVASKEHSETFRLIKTRQQ